jgi:hypothetical protein
MTAKNGLGGRAERQGEEDQPASEVVARRLVTSRFEPNSIVGPRLRCKGGGKPPHSKVGRWRIAGSGYAIV